MVALDDLTRLGWALSESGFNYLLSEAEDGASAKDLADIALDTDLKIIGQVGCKIGPHSMAMQHRIDWSLTFLVIQILP